jgi:L-ascorbate metabolism protein UlaG (beta-lactamase superfamily)
MNNPLLYLKPNVQVEPLVDRWYAWPHLIPPATAARNMTERHMKIMNSYVTAPQIHASAVTNPKLLGGPFIDYGGKRVQEIRALHDETKATRADLVELSGAILELDTLLRSNARGFSLEPLYERIPPALRGYVELVYDLNNHASFRLIEPLLYNSTYFHRTAQNLVMSTTNGDHRPFVLSTPRLREPNLLELPLSFDDERVDWLFRLKREPRTWNEIRERLNVARDQEHLLTSLLTETNPEPYTSYTGNGVRWRYFGHACILIETRGVTMLLDPVLSYTYESTISRYTYDNLPEQIDFVLITHNHQDHILFETLLQIRHKVKTVVVPPTGAGSLQDPSVKLLLEAIGFRNVVELKEMETIAFEGGSISGLPFLGEHNDLNIRSKLAYLFRSGRNSLLFAADSCNIDPTLYQHLHRTVGDVSALFLGMECDGAPLTWLYGPLLTMTVERSMDQSRRLAGSNYEQAIRIVEDMHCNEVYVYAMGQEPWLNHIMNLKYTAESRPIVESNLLLQACQDRGIHAERLFGEREILIET